MTFTSDHFASAFIADYPSEITAE